MTSAVWLYGWLAKPPPEESVNPGALGSLVVLALVVVTGLLVWSFTRQLGKVTSTTDRRDRTRRQTTTDVRRRGRDEAGRVLRRRRGGEPG
jgi:hypothetical protein